MHICHSLVNICLLVSCLVRRRFQEADLGFKAKPVCSIEGDIVAVNPHKPVAGNVNVSGLKE